MGAGDQLRKFVFERFAVRGQLVELEDTWASALERHSYPAAVRKVLGEAMAASALLASMLKLDGRMSLQLQGGGLLKLLLVQCATDLSLRGMARAAPEVGHSERFPSLVAGGRLAITIEPDDRERYQGIVPLEGGNLGACIEGYFRNSEQLPTRLWLRAERDRVAGLLLQKLPSADGDPGADRDWRRVQLAADAAASGELLQTSGSQLLSRLFSEDDVRVFAPAGVRFQCRCSRGRIESVLRMIGAAQLRETLIQEGEVRVCCEFCNENQVFDAIDVEVLLSVAPGGSSRTAH